MKNSIYKQVKEFKRKYPFTIAFRLKAHAKVAAQFVGSDEEVIYVFTAQKNFQSYEIINTNIVILTNKRLIVATKRLVFGYFFKMITPEMFNDLTIKDGIIWGKVIIDTIKEQVILSNIDHRALAEIENNITKVMLEEKKKYKERVNEE
ncbi:MAG: PH domain-containing protein [Bacilli bacterium]